jgi:hypothetical protein
VICQIEHQRLSWENADGYAKLTEHFRTLRRIAKQLVNLQRRLVGMVERTVLS